MVGNAQGNIGQRGTTAAQTAGMFGVATAASNNLEMLQFLFVGAILVYAIYQIFKKASNITGHYLGTKEGEASMIETSR